MDDRERLGVVLGFVGLAADAEEILQGAALEAWRLVESEEWWRAEYGSWEEFTKGCGLGESVADLMRRKGTTERLKRKFEAEAVRAWGGSENLKEVLGEELMPKRVGKTFLEKIKTLSKELNDVRAARRILMEERDKRQLLPGSIKDGGLQLRDVEAALSEVRSRKRRAIGPPAVSPPNVEGKQNWRARLT